jgi:diguanylate cyclase
LSRLQVSKPEVSGSLSGQIQQRMAAIEKRDVELWILALAMVGILAAGYFLLVFPSAFLGQHLFFVPGQASSSLVVGQVALVLLFLTYIAHKHIEIRGLRTQSVFDALNHQLSHTQLLIDPLTHAFNRAALEEVVSKEIKRVQRGQSTLVFLYVDVDELKRVNTTFGHLSGDLVLAEVGAILKGCVRGSDYVIRMGGDEFLVALIDTTVAGATVVKQRIQQRAARWSEHSPLDGFRLRMSVGMKEFDGSRSMDDVLADADAEMYAEKQSHTLARAHS